MEFNTFAYTFVPVIGAIAAASAAATIRFSANLVSAIQHFAAGVVFAAAAGEILPDVMHRGSPWATLIGGAIAVLAMLLVKQLEQWAKGPSGLLTVVGIDLLIDGLVLGIGFTAGPKAGLLLTAALTVEVLFLGLTLASQLAETVNSPSRTVATTAALVLLLPIGALLGAPAALLPGPLLTGFLSFGLIALLYLVTEELLVEAHEIPDRPWVTAMFFVGFMALLLLEEAIG